MIFLMKIIIIIIIKNRLRVLSVASYPRKLSRLANPINDTRVNEGPLSPTGDSGEPRLSWRSRSTALFSPFPKSIPTPPGPPVHCSCRRRRNSFQNESSLDQGLPTNPLLLSIGFGVFVFPFRDRVIAKSGSRSSDCLILGPWLLLMILFFLPTLSPIPFASCSDHFSLPDSLGSRELLGLYTTPLLFYHATIMWICVPLLFDAQRGSSKSGLAFRMLCLYSSFLFRLSLLN